MELMADVAFPILSTMGFCWAAVNLVCADTPKVNKDNNNNIVSFFITINLKLYILSHLMESWKGGLLLRNKHTPSQDEEHSQPSY